MWWKRNLAIKRARSKNVENDNADTSTQNLVILLRIINKL